MDDRLDAALGDDRVHLPPEPRVGEHLEDVHEAAARPVQAVLALAVALEPPGDRYLGEAAGERALGVVEHDLHLGSVARVDAVAAGEDHVLHRLPADRERALLAERPEDAVGDVRLAGPVRPDDHRHAGREVEPRAIGEGLEALQGDPLQVHQPAAPGSGGQSSSTCSSACEAASCSAAFFVFPRPRPISSPETSCAGPRASTMR